MRLQKRWAAWLLVSFLAIPGVALADGALEADVPAQEEDEEQGSAASIDAMHEFLVAEFAAQRGDTESALAIHLRMARELRDAQLARRAVELAVRSRAYGPALDGASLLFELDPESALAREIIAALLANEGDLGKARDKLALILDKHADRGRMLTQLSHLFGKFNDKAAVLEATRAIVGRYPPTAESHYALGVAALVAGRFEESTRETDAALAMRPGWQQAAILKAQGLRKDSPAAVIAYYESFVRDHPASLEVRMQLGRELATEKKLAEARAQFREAEKLARGDSHPAYAIGLLSLQLEDFREAQVAFTRALRQGHRDPAAIYLGLGQAAEGMKRFDEAVEWYQKVESGDWVRAQIKIAQIMARQQGLAAGREYLKGIEARSEEDRIQVIQVEASLLRDAKAWRETYDVLSRGVLQYPESYELLYDRAMAAERIDRVDVLEADLKRVIRMKPDYAHAYNALGYTLAEKTDRLQEARELIEKAFKLAPDDPFILDSLGWVHYRLGNVETAVKYLQRAYGMRPDPEIAAHLGEVLWKVGQKDEARKVWSAALTDNPDHETLTTVMQKFRP